MCIFLITRLLVNLPKFPYTSAPHKLKSATLVYIGPIVAVVLCFWAFPVFLLFSLRVGVPARYQSSFDQVIDRYRYRGPNCSPVVPLLAACRLCPVASGASLLVIVLLIHDSRQFRVSFLFSFFSLFLVAFSWLGSGFLLILLHCVVSALCFLVVLVNLSVVVIIVHRLRCLLSFCQLPWSAACLFFVVVNFSCSFVLPQIPSGS